MISTDPAHVRWFTLAYLVLQFNIISRSRLTSSPNSAALSITLAGLPALEVVYASARGKHPTTRGPQCLV